MSVIVDEYGDAWADVGALTDEEAAMLRPRQVRRLQALDRRLDRVSDRLQRTRARFGMSAPAQAAPAQAAPEVGRNLSMADAYQIAAAQGMVKENQYDGLGRVAIPAASTAILTTTVNRSYWIKSFVFSSGYSVPAGAGGGVLPRGLVTVNAITIAGLPVNIGAQGAPAEMFSPDGTRFGLSFGRQFVQTGQIVQVTFQNFAADAVSVTGGLIVDEVNPYAAQAWTQHAMINAAINGFGLGSTCGG